MNRFLVQLFSASALLYPLAFGHPRGIHRSRLLKNVKDVSGSYDYIIVGGGTAGLTVADRLTEDGTTSVLVIEYGQLLDSPLISTVQGGFQGMNSAFMYPVVSVPQVHLHNRTTPVLIGKGVGGSSAVNAMMSVRGTTEDYDRWGGFFGNSSSWSWQGLLPYFKKALTFVPPDDDVAKSAHIKYDTSFWGNSSGVYTGWPSFQYPGTTMQFEAFKEIPGVEFPPDSGSGQAGVYWFPTLMNPKTVTRSYARTGHYDNLNRSNYHLLTGAKVTQILLDNGIASGVKFLSSSGNSTSNTSSTSTSTTTIVNAKNEVILAAGGIHSPQILQLSGIGPTNVLSAANITTIVDLPGVGQNFQDHPMLSIAIVYGNFTIHPSPTDLFTNATFATWASQSWAANRTGPYSLAIGNAAAWLPFPVISDRSEDIASRLLAQDHAAQLPQNTDPTVIAGYTAQMQSLAIGLRSKKTAFYSGTLTGSGSPTLVYLHPLSRGTVNIDPRDPEGREPIVDYRALSNPLDAAIMVDILRFTRRLFFNTTAHAQFSPREVSPGDYVNAEEDLAGYIAETMTPSEYHPVGTCAMLPKELGGVVDEELKVYGVKNLRVVDGSIMPTLPGANTCQTVYAVAEKAADLIKARAKSTTRPRTILRGD